MANRYKIIFRDATKGSLVLSADDCNVEWLGTEEEANTPESSKSAYVEFVEYGKDDHDDVTVGLVPLSEVLYVATGQ